MLYNSCLTYAVNIGIGLTFWAFYGAVRAVRKRDSEKAQIMFRRRLYAQSFTLVAAVGGSIYFKEGRTRRKEFEGKIAENKAHEKRDQWIRELEARDQDDKAWKAKMDAIAAGAKAPKELKVPAVLTKKDTSVKE